LSTFFSIERGTRLKKSDREDGNVPLVTAGKDNSGVADFVTPTINKEYTDKITIDMFGNVFYHSETFVCDDNILVLIEKEEMSSNVKKFITACISYDNYKYDYNRQYRQKDFLVHKIWLPADDNNNPDWQWMDNYISLLDSNLDDYTNSFMDIVDNDKNLIKIFANKIEIEHFKNWLKCVDNTNNAEILLTEKKWNYFELSTFFSIERGTRLKKSDREDGNVPLVTAGKDNSGVADFVTPTINKEYTDKITIDMFGNVFYHSETFVCDDNILVLMEKEEMSPNEKKFITTCINFDNYKYDYNRQYRQKDFLVHKIWLPADDNNNPDWQWMDNYISTLPSSDA
nr:restriction endonuclease subunit S [Cyanobacteria bacterium RUI128]